MRKFVAFCMMALATVNFAGAADIKSGLQVDEFPAAFNVTDITGPSAGEKLCYRPGELFSYQDIVWRDGIYRNDAFARTPVEILRLDRLRFLNLLHNHPTLAVLLISQQHERLREQRTSGTCCY